jgi:phosphatidylinositol-3-phosphatase
MQLNGQNCARIWIHNDDFNNETATLDQAKQAIDIARSFGFWVIIDWHGYTYPDWNQWQPFVQGLMSYYDKILWQPMNEPGGADKTNTFTQKLTLWQTAYQNWINNCRALGDNHFIIIENVNYVDISHAGTAYAPLTDPLKSLYASFHDYYFFSDHSSAWSLADADSFAAMYLAQVDLAHAQFGRFITTELGADAGPSSVVPDNVIGGSAGYAPESLEFLNQVVKGLSSRGYSYIFWPGGDWTDTPNAGATGAMLIWGQLVGKPVNPPPPPTPGPLVIAPLLPIAAVVGSTVTFGATASGGVPPYTYNWSFGDGLTGTGNSIPHTYTSTGVFTVSLTVTDSTLKTATATEIATITTTPPPPPPPVSGYQIIIVALENKNYSDVIGSSSAPFINGLVALGATIPKYQGGLGSNSEPNYVAMVAGQTFGSSDTQRNLGTCSTPVISQLFDKASISWKVIQDADNNWRGGDHNGWLDLSAIATQTGSGPAGYGPSSCPNSPAWFSHLKFSSNLPADVIAEVKAGTQFIWVTPGDSLNMHDNSVSSGDTWLSTWLPQLLALPQFQPGGKGILMLWWDENSNPPNMFIGPPIKPNYKATGSYSHYSTLAFIESLLQLGNLGANDATATPMLEILA